jgi:exosortase O
MVEHRQMKLLAALAANLAILFLWAWLYKPVYAYLRTIFTRQEFRTNQIVLLGVVALILLQARRGQFRLALWELPQLHPAGLALALAGSLGFIAAERWLDINTLSATLFGLASYGLLGLWMEPGRWRRGLPAALLLTGALPFGEHLDTFVGFPLRLAIARTVSAGMAALRIPNVGVDTILIFENGLSQVDSPCSGVKSLWTGGLFLLAATWIEARPVSRRWLLVVLGFALLLVAANLARVALLVLVGQVAGWRLLAEMLHVPLGIIGFGAACLAALGMLRWTGTALDGDQAGTPGAFRTASPAAPARPRWLAPALVIALVGLVALYTPRADPAAAAAFDWRFPPGLEAEPWPLIQEELDWLSESGALPVTAARWRFKSGSLGGSLLFVTSDTWRAQHRPERCFTVYGLEVQESRLHLAGDGFPLRWLTLGYGKEPALYSAAYWLQSSDRITEDYAARIWDDLAPQPEPWVLVTVLFDTPVDLDSDTTRELFAVLRASVQETLAGSGLDAQENNE